MSAYDYWGDDEQRDCLLAFEDVLLIFKGLFLIYFCVYVCVSTEAKRRCQIVWNCIYV